MVLIICTGNACRSQMAEAFLREAAGEAVEVASAGSNPAGMVHPRVREVMAEKGFDLRGAKSQHMDEYLDREVAVVITVCDAADETCPTYPGQVQRYHWPFKDPIRVVGTEEMILEAFRRSRDEIETVFTLYGLGLADGLGWERSD